MKESVSERVRRFKENSPRLRIFPAKEALTESLEISPLSSCNSVDDILAVLRAKATETLQIQRQSISTDLSGILHEIRTSCSETSRSEEPILDERRRVKDLLKRISLGTSKEEEDDPLAVIARIKQRLGSSDSTVRKSCSMIQDSIILNSPVAKLCASTSEIANIPQRPDPTRQCIALQTVSTPKPSDLSVVSVPVEKCVWPETAEQNEERYIKSLPLDPNWRRHIESEIRKTRESIYLRIGGSFN